MDVEISESCSGGPVVGTKNEQYNNRMRRVIAFGLLLPYIRHYFQLTIFAHAIWRGFIKSHKSVHHYL